MTNAECGTRTVAAAELEALPAELPEGWAVHCAWCRKFMRGERTKPVTISHGMCAECAQIWRVP